MIYKELKPSHMTYLLAQIIFESVCVWLNLPPSRVQRASRAQSVIGRHADRAALCDARAFQIHLHTTMKITVSGARHIYSKPPTRIVRAPDQVIFVFTVHHRLCYMATQVRWCWALLYSDGFRLRWLFACLCEYIYIYRFQRGKVLAMARRARAHLHRSNYIESKPKRARSLSVRFISLLESHRNRPICNTIVELSTHECLCIQII